MHYLLGFGGCPKVVGDDQSTVAEKLQCFNISSEEKWMIFTITAISFSKHA